MSRMHGRVVRWVVQHAVVARGSGVQNVAVGAPMRSMSLMIPLLAFSRRRSHTLLATLPVEI